MNKLIRLTLGIFLAISLTMFWYLRYRAVRIEMPEEMVRVVVTDVLREEPVVEGQAQKFRLGQVWIRTRAYPRYHYGDQLRIEGMLTPFLAMNYPEIEKFETGESLTLMGRLVGGLYKFRNLLSSQIEKFLPEPHAALLSGILLGIKKGLPSDFAEILKISGTIHVVVVSGYNISIIGRIFASATKFLGRVRSIIASLIGILLFTLMVGAEAPVVRAALMGSIAMLAQATGRQRDALRALYISAAIMLIASPLILFDIGFQLSFLATFGLLTLEPFLKRLSLRPLQYFGLKDDFTATVAAQLMVWPIIAYHFGRVSVVSVFVNTFTLWVIPPLMAIGAGLIVASFIGLGTLIAPFAWILLEFFVKSNEWSAQLPLASLELEFSRTLLVAYYAMLGIAVFLFSGAWRGLVPPDGFPRFARSRRSAGHPPPAPPAGAICL